MSYAARLVHSLVIVTPTAGADDDYGHPATGTPTTEAVPGLVQPRTARELALLSQAGPPLTDHVIFLGPRQLSSASYIADADAAGDPLAGGRRFEIVGIRSFDFGSSPHLEVDVKLVGNPVGAGVGS